MSVDGNENKKYIYTTHIIGVALQYPPRNGPSQRNRSSITVQIIDLSEINITVKTLYLYLMVPYIAILSYFNSFFVIINNSDFPVIIVFPDDACMLGCTLNRTFPCSSKRPFLISFRQNAKNV